MQQRIDEYAEMHGFSAWFATSAKENYGFKDAVDFRPNSSKRAATCKA